MSAPSPRSEPIALVCAMPMELKPLARRLSLRKQTTRGLELHSGTSVGGSVVAMTTGMGTELAAAGIARLLDAVRVRHVLVFGITGAVNGDTAIGTLVLPETVVHGAKGTEHKPTYATSMTERPRGKMRTGDDLLTSPEALARLGEEGIVALDMETASIAEICESRDMPWSVYRVVSDRAGDGALDDEVFGITNQNGSIRPGAAVRYFARHPHKVPPALRLARDANRAANLAAEAVIRACSSF